MPRFMLMIKGDPETLEEFVPDEHTVREMRAYSQEMIDAGVLISAEGLEPSSKGARVAFSRGGKQTVTDGPFAEAKEVVAGFWMIETGSLAEAIAWAQRSPVGRCLVEGQDEGQIEVRQIFDVMSPEAPDGLR